jgi:hypothetical protein
MTYKIDDDVPLPEPVRKPKEHGYNAAMRRMQPGQSVFLPGYARNAASRATGEKAMNMQYARRTMPGTTWAIRTVTENGVRGVRVWRTA